MRFAALGTDEELVDLLRAVAAAGHEIVWLGDLRPSDEAAVRQIAPEIIPSRDWELLLDQATADAVLVGRGTAGDDERAEQLQRLVTEGIAILATHPVSESVLLYYGLDMLRRENHGLLVHFHPLVGHPKIAELARWVRSGDSAIGRVHQISCERSVADTSRTTVLVALARDAELLATVAGSVRQVSAVGPDAADASYASLQAQMTSQLGPTLRWSVAPAWNDDEVAEIVVTLLGERGMVRISIPPGHSASALSPRKLETSIAGERTFALIEPYDAAAAAVERFTRALGEQESEKRALLSTWDSATRSMEVVDAVELSLQKGRTIEVHQQQLTERIAFRGTMAALGCGLLLIGFFLLIGVALIGGIETIVDQKLIRPWPIAVLVVLAFFLLLQTVPMLAAKRPDRPPPAEDDKHVG